MVQRPIEENVEIITALSTDPSISQYKNTPSQLDSDQVIVVSPAYFRNRMLVCFLAVGLNWGASLRIANYFASSVIETPPLDLVLDSCQDAYDVTTTQKSHYSTCVVDNLKACDNKLDQSIHAEDERVSLISKRNEVAFQDIVKTTTSCSTAYTTLRLALEDWTANGGVIQLQSGNESFCSAKDHDLFNRTLLGTQNIIALQTEAMGIVDAYGEESVQTVQRLADYAVERAHYDVEYVDKKTQQIQGIVSNVVNSVEVPPVSLDDLFDELEKTSIDIIACLSLDVNSRMSDGNKCNPNLAAMIDEYVQNAKWKVDILQEALREYKEKMIEYKQNVQSAYKVAKAFYNGVNNSVTQWIVNTFFHGSWFRVDLADMTPVDVEFPDVDQIIASIGSFQSIASIWQGVISSVGLGFYSKLGSISSGITARFDDLVTRIQLAYSTSVQLVPFLIPEDYNPPIYEGTSDLATSPGEELSLFQSKHESFRFSSRSALGLFSGIGSKYNESGADVTISSINITDIKSKVTTVNLNFESLAEPDIDYKLWFLQFSSMLDKMVFFDYIFRAYITVKLIFKYWFATSLTTPQIDIRVNKDIRNPFRMNPTRAAVSFITSPFCGFVVFLVVGTWMVIVVSALYLPLFHSYLSGCISGNDNGTFITKNLFSLSYNHAYQEGSGLLLNGLDAFDTKRGDACSSRYAASITSQNNINSNYTAYVKFHSELSDSMRLAQRCIDAEKLNSSFLEACCGYPTYPSCLEVTKSQNIACPIDDRREISTIQMPYELPGMVLQEPACFVSIDDDSLGINEIIFNCEELASCEMVCNEPQRELLIPATEKCGCAIEWFIHSEWLGTALAFLLYFLMNVARVFFIGGTTRLLWRYIYPERFTVLVTCDSNGALVTTSKGTFASHNDLIKAIQVRSFSSQHKCDKSQERHLSKDLRSKLSRSLKNFYIIGAAEIVVSLVAIGVWVYIIVMVSQSLTPTVLQ